MKTPGDVNLTLPVGSRGAADTARSVSVVIPTKNEAANIGWVLDRMPSIVDEVVLVDGESTDGTVEVARAHRPDIVVVHEAQRGKGTAVRAGVAAASGDVVVMLDADGSMDPTEIGRFVEPLFDGHHLSRGSRFMPGAGTSDMTLLRDAGNRVLLAIANVLFGTARTDLCYGYAAFRRDAFHRLGLTATGFEIEAQLFLRSERMGYRVAEVPSFESPRRNGTSNLNTFRDGLRVFLTVFAERIRRLRPADAREAIREGSGARAEPAPGVLTPVPIHVTNRFGHVPGAAPPPSRWFQEMYVPEPEIGPEPEIWGPLDRLDVEPHEVPDELSGGPTERRPTWATRPARRPRWSERGRVTASSTAQESTR